jgi:transmembrane sensor
MNNRQVSQELLKKYLEGDCTEEEKEKVENWYQSLEAASVVPQLDENALFAKVKAGIAEELEVQRNESIQSPFRKIWLYAGGIAASLLMVLSFVFWNKTGVGNTLAAKSAHNIEFVNFQKQIVKYKLPDGTFVWLNPGSVITYAVQFTENRTVSFKGEGFFQVKRDTLHPFRILTGKMETRVLGTSFNVKALAGSKSYEVSVVSGKVAVSVPDKTGKMATVFLTPARQFVYELETRHSDTNIVRIKPTENDTWQPVSLVFDDENMGDVALKLEKTFKIRIHFTDESLRRCLLKVDFEKQRLPEILDMISLLLNTKYEMSGDEITLSGEGCSE